MLTSSLEFFPHERANWTTSLLGRVKLKVEYVLHFLLKAWAVCKRYFINQYWIRVEEITLHQIGDTQCVWHGQHGLGEAKCYRHHAIFLKPQSKHGESSPSNLSQGFSIIRESIFLWVNVTQIFAYFGWVLFRWILCC